MNGKPGKNRIFNNDGAALVTVVIAMLFIVALGAALLFAAYSGATVKAAERGDRKNFYTAEEAMDELRGQLQGYMSQVLSAAYTTALTNYAGDTDGVNPQAEFAAGAWEGLITAQGDHINPLVSTTGGTHYNMLTLETLLGNKPGVSLGIDGKFVGLPHTAGKVICANAEGQTVHINAGTPDGVISTITLKNVSVRSISEDGYEAIVNTDMVLTIPDFYAKAITAARFSDYSVMTKETFVVEDNQHAVVHGDIYAGGGITIGANGSLTISSSAEAPGCNVVCGGDITLGAGATLTYTGADYEMWARNIVINGNGCTVNLNGNVYVADDLEINGKNANITLKGSYVGFGGSGTNMERSSSIVVNGESATLNMSGLTSFSMAGVSFIDVTPISSDVEHYPDIYDGVAPLDRDSDEVKTGQSLSVKSDQLAYLVPAECIQNYATNPYVFESVAEATAAIAEAEPDIDLSICKLSDGKTLADSEYGITPATYYKHLGDSTGPVIMYVFMKFRNTAAASAYFKDYLSGNADAVAQYLNTYLEEWRLPANTGSAGVLYYFDEDGELKVKQSGGTGGANSAGFRERLYESKRNSCLKMVTDIMDRFRAIRAVNKPGTNEFFYSRARGFKYTSGGRSANAVATMPDGVGGFNDYNYDKDHLTEKFIICADASENDTITSRVIIGESCDCIILAEKDIIVRAGGHEAEISGIYDDNVLEARNNTSNPNSVRFGDILGDVFGDGDFSRDPWAPEYLVTYKNWKKN